MMIRLFDLLFSSTSLVVLSPLFILVILILRFTGEREIFFYQERVGKNKIPFKLIKFVTMMKDSEKIGTKTITVQNDPRILPFGKILRKTKINELPQLINIFNGDMSLVGPRPLTKETFGYYSYEIQENVSKVRPGLSGVGSIFFRDEENILKDIGQDTTKIYKNVLAPYKGQLELWYVSNATIFTYFKVILITVWVVLFPKSGVFSRFFKDLPRVPDELTPYLN